MSFTFIVPQIALALRKESALVMAGAIALSFDEAIALYPIVALSWWKWIRL